MLAQDLTCWEVVVKLKIVDFPKELPIMAHLIERLGRKAIGLSPGET